MFLREEEENSQVERCAVCAKPTTWVVWALPMCDSHVREWEVAVPSADIEDDTSRHAEMKHWTAMWAAKARAKRGGA